MSSSASPRPGRADPTVGDLYTLYLAPDVWCRGIGTRLHDVALDRLRSCGLTHAGLWVLDTNERAPRFAIAVAGPIPDVPSSTDARRHRAARTTTPPRHERLTSNHCAQAPVAAEWCQLARHSLAAAVRSRASPRDLIGRELRCASVTSEPTRSIGGAFDEIRKAALSVELRAALVHVPRLASATVIDIGGSRAGQAPHPLG